MTPRPPLFAGLVQYDARITDQSMATDITASVMLDRTTPGQIAMSGTAFGQPVSENVEALRAADVDAAQAAFYEALDGVDLLNHARLLAVGEQLEPNTTRMLFQAGDPKVGAFDATAARTDEPTKPLAMWVLDEQALSNDAFKPALAAFEAWGELAFPDGEFGGATTAA